MKKLAILAMTVLLVMAVIPTQAQKTEKVEIKKTKQELKSERKELRKLEGAKVSELAKTHFYADYGNMPNVKWRRDAKFDVASFTKDGKKVEAFYDYDANLVGTTTDKTFADLPAKVQQEIKTKYKGYTIGSVVFYDDNEANETDMLLYGLQFEDADNYFVELIKKDSKIVVKIDTAGFVSFFKKL